VDSFVLLGWVVIPITLLFINIWVNWRTTQQWHEEVTRLGLNPTGTAPELGLSGQFRGVNVVVTHQVQERYKQSPLVTFVARASLSDAGRSRDVPEPSSSADATGTVQNGWFERSVQGGVSAKQLEWHLFALVAAAHHASKYPAAYDETDADDQDGEPESFH